MLISSACPGRRGNAHSRILLGSNHVRLSVLIVSMMALVSLYACGGGSGSGSGGINFNFYTAVVVADLNGDGKLDIATCYSKFSSAPPHPGIVAIFIQDPANPGKFLAPVTYAVGNDPFSIAAADLNGDGKPDIVTANTGLGPSSGAGSNSVSVLVQDSTHPGQFLPAANYTSANSINSVVIGDLNGDGRPDLAVADSSGISFLLQSPTSPGIFVPGNGVSIPGGAASVAIGDLNGDGVPDLVAATDANVQVVLADPASPGSFLAPVSYQAGQYPHFVALGDLNGDGKPDLAVADMGSPAGSGALFGVHVLLQNPATPGTFLAAANYAPSTITNMLAIADLNNDGKLDLATANLSGGPTINGAPSGTASVLLQTPASPGQFPSPANYPGTSFVWWVAVGDMNGDGRPDLVTAEGGIVVRFQDPANPGKFLAPIVIAKE